MGRFLGTTKVPNEQIRVPANKKTDGLVGGALMGLKPEAADIFYLKVVRDLLTHRYCDVHRGCQQMLQVFKDTPLFFWEWLGSLWQ